MTEMPNDAMAKAVMHSMIDNEKVFVIIVPEKIKTPGDGDKLVWVSNGKTRIHSVGIGVDVGAIDGLVDLLRNTADGIAKNTLE